MFDSRSLKEKYDTMKAEFDRMVKEHKDLADEYVTLKNNYLVVAKENELLVFKFICSNFPLIKICMLLEFIPSLIHLFTPSTVFTFSFIFILQLTKNEELSTELLNLVNAKATLIRQLENYSIAGINVPHLGNENPEAELERIKAIGNAFKLFLLHLHHLTSLTSPPSALVTVQY